MMNGSFLMFCLVFYFDFSEFVDMMLFVPRLFIFGNISFF